HVDHVDGAAGDRLVGERVLDDADVGQAEAVVPAQSRPAVVTLEKPGREGGAQLRMASQVAEALEPQAPGHVVANGQRVGVLEPEWIADREPQRTEPRPERRERL